MGLCSQVLCTYRARTGRNHTSTEMDAFDAHVPANEKEYIFSKVDIRGCLLNKIVFLHPPSNLIFCIIVFTGKYFSSGFAFYRLIQKK